ncbi:MAG: hypothetical protein H7329_05260 [Opitutaceae bacterium]|nr:hypothetical protein [Cytophagales bacterium]
MEHLENLSPEESHELLTAPAYISLLAATHDGEMDDTEKKAAIKLTHLKTFSSDEFLNSFYKEVETNFTSLVDEVYHALPHDAAEREIALRNKLHSIENIVAKLPAEYGQRLKHSFESYSWHVAQSHRSVSEDFLIPLKIKGLTA